MKIFFNTKPKKVHFNTCAQRVTKKFCLAFFCLSGTFIPLLSEPIFHHNKDCDEVKYYSVSFHLFHSEPIFHHNKDCDFLIPPLVATSTMAQNPSSTTTRIATTLYNRFRAAFYLSEPIFHHNKDCDTTTS